MPRPTDTQTGVFFSLLASALILILTALALVGANDRAPRVRTAQIELSHVPAAQLSGAAFTPTSR